VSDLLPHTIRHAVAHQSVFAASQSFGVVALVLLVALLVEREALRVARFDRARRVAFSICSASLLVTLALTIAARLATLAH
jgi:hypothetical protein